MRITIDKGGRVVIPKALRDRVGLQAGMELEIACRDGLIEISPPLTGGRVVREGSVLVWEAPPGAPKIAPAEIDEAIRSLREERGEL